VTGTLTFVAIISGASVGSFGNCVAWRIQKRMKWWGNERSACPACSAPIRSYDNIPILSYLVLRGKCRKCGTKIPVKYLLAEVGGAVAAVVIAYLLVG
jgi:leader peptidase (prepilin peptidase)/N-methyltransferase